MNFILDTNVISELIAKQPNPKVVAWVNAQDPQRVHLTVITIGEIRKEVAKLPDSKRKFQVQQWLEGDLLSRFHGRILPITTDVMLRWGDVMGELEQRGVVLAAIDSLIAAIALEQNYALVTRNEVDFAATGVTIINPWTL
jgi:tRNA(fMet)-specific endonuclease VapC